MKQIYSFAILVFACILLSSVAGGQTVQPVKTTGAIPINENEVFDINGTLYNSCTGEDVQFSGKVHLNLHGTMNDNKVTTYFHFNAQNIIGIGLTSGKLYTGSQTETYIDNHPLVGDKITYAYAFKLKMISAGSQDNMLMVENYHITVNASGTGTATRGDTYVECQ